jgi:site-specific DNA recombinase
MKAVGYCRVSSQEQINGTSMESQQEQIRAYATLKGLDLVDILVDAGVSGGKALSERAEGQKLVEVVDAGEVQAVVITKLDRGFRSTVDCLQTVQTWEKSGIALHIVDMGGNAVDTISAAGKFMLTVLVAAAEMERGRINERCNEGRRVRKAQGYRIGEIPFGYNVDEDRKLFECEQEQKVIARVHALKGKGFSFRKIATDLNQHGYVTKKRSAWTHIQVAAVFRRVA